MVEPLRYEEHLKRLLTAAGEPTSNRLSREIEKKHGLSVAPQTIDDWRACRFFPRDTGKRHAFLATLESLARARSRDRLHFPGPDDWNRLLEEARKRRTSRAGDDARTVSPPPVPTASRQDWLSAVEQSEAWKLVVRGAEDRAGALKEQTGQIAGRLAELYDEKRNLCAEDPWYDPDLARRTTRWVNYRLADINSRLGTRTLAAAEASLISLLPFLYQVRNAWTVAALRHVDPTNLDERMRGGPERESYNRLLRNHKRLLRQARRGGELPDRRDGRSEVGWWLFHQWVKQQVGRPGQLDDMLDALDLGATEMGTVLDQPLLSRLLSCAHVGPRKLFAGRPEGLLQETPFAVDFDGRDAQLVREPLVGPLFAIAHAMAIEVTDLPSAVVKHVGIPEPLDPKQLLRRLNKAKWNPVGDTLALNADCDHPAAVAALTEHARHLDALLREARRTRPTEEIGALPVYAHADGVREVDEEGAPRQAGEVIRFRLDEERIQELLMGENLYRDRSLAIRELYQNALDACRYRRAFQLKQDGRDTFQGEITFRQGYDPDEHRYYLECEDNGIGMDEIVLADVFSRAGVRFRDHSRFQEQARRWEGDGITVHPNSRFGIGVLSYFMLADEIRVTTCPLNAGEARPEQLTVLITGPGHYFRVRRTGEPGKVGTTVRLYLRDGDRAPSCVRELRRLLGIADFETKAAMRGSEDSATWRPGVLRAREATGGRSDGFVAHGRTVSWPEGGRRVDGQVVWCEHGGGLLADGIFIEPRVRRGVLAGPGEPGRLWGVVVNLTGESRPKDLSVDRTQILDPDVGMVVEQLITAALPALFAAGPPLLTGEWLAEVARHSPRLADIVTKAAGEAGVVLELHGHPAPVATVGFFPPDVTLVHEADRGEQWSPAAYVAGLNTDDATLLWRLLAHRPNAELTALAGVVPELSLVRAVLPARPSDVLMRSTDSGRTSSRDWIDPAEDGEPVRPGHVLSVAGACGVSYDEALARMDRLRLPVPARPDGPAVAVDATMVALLDRDLRGVDESFSGHRWLRVAPLLPPGHFVKAHLMLNVGVDEAAGRMKELGFSTAETEIRTESPEDWVVRLLSDSLDGSPPWLTPSEPVPAGQVLWAMRELDRSLEEVVGRLRDYGLRPETGSLDERSARELLRLSDEWGWPDSVMWRLDVRVDVPPGFLALASLRSGVPLHDIARRVEELGFSTGSLPEQVADTDVVFLGLREHVPYTHEAGAEVSLVALVDRAADSGLPPKAVAERMRAYGLKPQDTGLPDRLGPDDREILGAVYSALPSGADDLTALTIPMLATLEAAERTRVSPQAVIDCLHRYGVRTAHATAPASPSRYDSELVSLRTNGAYLDWSRPVPLFHLVTAPPALLMSQEDVIGRLVEFGLEVPAHALEGLDETDLSLCRDVFGQQRTELPLALGDPIEDFLAIARHAALPLEDLLPRLTRLDVDLPRVAEAVRAALPYVPGLVMASEGEDDQAATTDDSAPAT
ncbi:hypothetical protein ABZ471_24520 [Streptomyces sp. NPDC005728]|uniref:wHTH domain-containing protein n=1 Tax=Streptomyces sp. NPDC005728 TaxID=3157054 RepID=UPI0033BFF9F7